MNSAVNTIATASMRTAQSRGGSSSHRPNAITAIVTSEWIHALCWVLSTYHHPRSAWRNELIREVMNSLMVIVFFSDVTLSVAKGLYYGRQILFSRDERSLRVTGYSLLTNLYLTQPQRFQNFALSLPHLCLLSHLCMIVTEQMQHAMHHQ